jgi:hypothetical protein
MNTPTPFERELGKLVRLKLGEQTKVVRFADEGEINDVYIVSSLNFPVDGVSSYASVGLSRNMQGIGVKGVKVEIIAACATLTPDFDNLVASCVFDSIKNGSNIVYGASIANVIMQYQISSSLKHVVFVTPFLWHGMDKFLVENEAVFYLMMLPISDNERLYLIDRGIDELEKVFNDKQIDIYDINRPSAL